MADDSRVMSFWDHLGELRSRLVRIALALLVGFVAAWSFREKIFSVVNEPIRAALARHDIYRLIAIDASEAIVVYLKLSFTAALVLISPVVLQQVWAFVKPGLFPAERRPVRRVVILSVFMFFIGVLFCYRLVLPLVIDFLTSFTLGGEGIDFQLTMSSAFSTALLLMLMFGLVFELPLVMVMLTATRLMNHRHFLKFIKYFIVMSFVIGAVFTPPDVVSQVLMAIPLVALYLIGTLLAYFIHLGRKNEDQEVEQDRRRVVGFDWPLLGGLVVLGGLIALLVWPAAPGIRDLVPRDPDLAVSWDRTRSGAPSQPLLDLPFWQRLDLSPDSLTAFLQGYYKGRGELLVVQGDPALEARCNAQTHTWDRGGACLVISNLIFIGHPGLLAEVEMNRDQSDPGPDPVFPSGQDAPLAVFLRWDGTERASQGLEVAIFSDDRVSLLVSLEDGGAARTWKVALDARIAAGLVEREPIEPDLVLEMADLLAELAGTAEPKVKARAGELAKRARARARLRSPGDGLGAAGAVLEMLEPPEEVEVDGSRVRLSFRTGEQDALLSRLLSLAADLR